MSEEENRPISAPDNHPTNGERGDAKAGMRASPRARRRIVCRALGDVATAWEKVMKAKRLCQFVAAFLFATSPSYAEELSGVWLRDTGEARLRFDACGDAMCGTIVWLRPGIASKAKVGQRVFYDMKPAGANSWTGKAVGPDTGSVYLGKMSVEGSHLSTSGCVAGGMICKSFNWTRVP
jgi:uncharacterized protein (DUF2147 family)